MFEKFVMTKPSESITREDLQEFWNKVFSNLKEGELWCSQKDYLDNNSDNVYFLYIGSNSEVIDYLADGVFELYSSDNFYLSCLLFVDLNKQNWINKDEFQYLAKEPTCIWKEGVLLAN